MDPISREQFDKLYPPDRRNPMMSFIIENSGVYEALQQLLNDAQEPGNMFTATLPPRHVPLVGGETQSAILIALARENGLEVREIPAWKGISGVTLEVPGKPLSLTVTYE
ncbi:hypothetical protein [Piscinibacter defluvii]|uniref:hypothetical protein n=1 Tax=Piscinibacter defluvii TaxID=1796922 RepID=UPI000FDE26EB|nr:hypothetical protein [Piscinibacter defluvii]